MSSGTFTKSSPHEAKDVRTKTRDLRNGGSEGPCPLSFWQMMKKCFFRTQNLTHPLFAQSFYCLNSQFKIRPRTIFVIKAFYEDDCQHCFHRQLCINSRLSQSPFSGFCYARNRDYNAVLSVVRLCYLHSSLLS